MEWFVDDEMQNGQVVQYEYAAVWNDVWAQFAETSGSRIWLLWHDSHNATSAQVD